MLNIFRKRAQSIFIQLMVLAIAIVFVFWGVSSNLINKGSAAATVNGEEISFQDFQRAYERTVDDYQEQFGGSIPPGLLDSLGIKKQVLTQLVKAELLRQGGTDMGVPTSELAMQNEIENMEAFQKYGRFDLEQYKQVLQQNRLAPSKFEAGLKQDILAQKVASLIKSFAFATQSEIDALIRYGDEKIKLQFASFEDNHFIDKVIIEEQALLTWFKEHKQEYQRDPQVKLQYLSFLFKDDIDKVTVEENVLKSRYESEKNTYNSPEKRQARHILFKVANKSDEALVKEKRDEAKEVLKLANQGKDFAALAQEYSEGPTKTRGGDLGFFTRGKMVQAFDEVVFSMQAGQISDIVESPFGFHIIKLIAVQPEMTKSYADVKSDIEKTIKNEQVKSVTYKRAAATYENIMRAGSLEKYGQNSQVQVQETDFFPKTSPPASISVDPKLRESLQTLNSGELSSLVELKNGYVILYNKEMKEALVPELSEVRDRATEAYKIEKSNELALEAANAFLKEASAKGQLASVAEQMNISLQQSSFMTRATPPGTNDPPAQVTSDAFALSWNISLPEKIISSGSTHYVYEVLERLQGEDSQNPEKQEQLQSNVLAAAQNRLLTSWLAEMETKSDIWTNTEFLQ